MSEYPGLKFAPQSPRSQILPSIYSLVLFVISMVEKAIKATGAKCKFFTYFVGDSKERMLRWDCTASMGHFDETLGANFFLFSETAFLEIFTSKVSGQNIE